MDPDECTARAGSGPYGYGQHRYTTTHCGARGSLCPGLGIVGPLAPALQEFHVTLRTDLDGTGVPPWGRVLGQRDPAQPGAALPVRGWTMAGQPWCQIAVNGLEGIEP